MRQIINEFPPDMPGTVIVQHMPAKFTKIFADQLNRTALVEVKEAASGDAVSPGRVLVAPGDYHTKVLRAESRYIVNCVGGEKVNGHRPSVGVLFDSLAACAGSATIAVMLTGMGRDGAEAMLTLRQSGARTLAQDRESCVVFGMPKEAYRVGGAERCVSLDAVTDSICVLLEETV